MTTAPSSKTKRKTRTSAKLSFVPLTVGDIIPGEQARYQLTRLLNEGAYSQAWLAVVQDTNGSPPQQCDRVRKGQRVVIKSSRIDPRWSRNEICNFVNGVNSTIQNEIDALRTLRGLNCVPKLFDFRTLPVQLSNGYPIMFDAQEFIDGERLDKLLTQHYAGSSGFRGIPEPVKWFDLAVALAKSLLDIHQKEMVHRDLWQENIMVRKSCLDPVFIDWGNSISRKTVGGSAPETREDNFVAPEGYGNQRWPQRRFDIFALGGIYYYFATGERLPPDRELHPSAVKKIVVTKMKEVNLRLLEESSGIPDLITRCRHRNPAKRVRDVPCLLNDLRCFSPRNDPQPPNLPSTIKALTAPAGNLSVENRLFARIVAKKLEELRYIIESMSNGVYDVNGSQFEIVDHLLTALELLKEGDEYLDTSAIGFWSPANLEIDGVVLAMNKLCAQRGVNIRRLFLVTPEEREMGDGLFGQVAAAHRRVQDQLAIGTTFETRYYTISHERQPSYTHQELYHSILICRDRAKLSTPHDLTIRVLPVCDKQQIIKALKLRLREEDPEPLRKQFDKFWGRGIPL